MTEGEIREAFEAALSTVINAADFELPLQVRHCAAIRDGLRPLLPNGALIDVFMRHDLIIEARVAGRVVSMAVPLS